MQCSQVFLIEDDKTIRDTLRVALEIEGYSVTTAANGLEALDQLHAGFRPGLILLDLMMPVMDGWQFSSIVRAEKDLAPIPIVLVTAYAERAEGLVAQAVIKKPVDLNTLYKTVRQYCGPPEQNEIRGEGWSRESER